MGVDFRADEEFPPDDTGYGFDTIARRADRLAPAAGKVHAGGGDDRGDVRPDRPSEPAAQTIPGCGFPPGRRRLGWRSDHPGSPAGTQPDRPGGPPGGAVLTFYKEAKLTGRFKAPHAGTYPSRSICR